MSGKTAVLAAMTWSIPVFLVGSLIYGIMNPREPELQQIGTEHRGSGAGAYVLEMGTVVRDFNKDGTIDAIIGGGDAYFINPSSNEKYARGYVENAIPLDSLAVERLNTFIRSQEEAKDELNRILSEDYRRKQTERLEQKAQRTITPL